MVQCPIEILHIQNVEEFSFWNTERLSPEMALSLKMSDKAPWDFLRKYDQSPRPKLNFQIDSKSSRKYHFLWQHQNSQLLSLIEIIWFLYFNFR